MFVFFNVFFFFLNSQAAQMSIEHRHFGFARKLFAAWPTTGLDVLESCYGASSKIATSLQVAPS